ncbi:MAG: M48 family metallopeptidase [Prevotellaceae bacterium]|jgi:predicted metal-dependent hydrolase|nr:M48 family metallopeptidase [Prevotellaceae bacterium]
MIQHPDFGEIKFEKTLTLRRLSVRILPDSLHVRLPWGSSEKAALQWIETEKQKILKKQQQLKEKLQKKGILISPENPLTTLTFGIIAKPANRETVFFSFKEKTLTIEFPQHKDCTSAAMQKIFWNGINYFLRREAQRILPPRVQYLADLHHFTYAKVSIRSSTSRWGSCAGKKDLKKNINLSFYLLLVPPHLIDYVLLHELCHTREMNHSPLFWAQMDSVTNGKSKALRQELKQYSMPAKE